MVVSTAQAFRLRSLKLSGARYMTNNGPYHGTDTAQLLGFRPRFLGVADLPEIVAGVEVCRLLLAFLETF